MGPTSLQTQLGLTSLGGKKKWKALQDYIGDRIREHIDLGPEAGTASQQEPALEKVINMILRDRSDWFTTALDITVLRNYVMKRISNRQFKVRLGAQHTAAPTGRPARRYRPKTEPKPAQLLGCMASDLGSSSRAGHRSSPYPTTSRRTGKGKGRAGGDQVSPGTSAVISSSSESRTHRIRCGPRRVGEAPLIALSKSDDEDTRRQHDSSPSHHISTPSSTTRRPTNSTPSDAQISVSPPRINERPSRDKDLLEFLKEDCQKPLPHLYQPLRAYGCETMKELRMISKWPQNMITDLTKQLQAKSDRMGGTKIKDIDWSLLAYAIWKLGGSRV